MSLPNIIKGLKKEKRSQEKKRESSKSSSKSGSQAGSRSESSTKASSDWTKASVDLGIFKPAESQYKQLKSTLEKDHKDKDYDLWWKADGSTMISIGKPDSSNYQASEGKTLGGVSFSLSKVKDDAKWSQLNTFATKHNEDDSWRNIF